jgi:hypothetical protein
MAFRHVSERVAAALAAALLAGGLLAAEAPAAAKSAGGSAAVKPSPAAPAKPRNRATGILPTRIATTDTVLARVGDRLVTATAFRRGWAQVRPPDRPDSLTPEGARGFLELLIDKELLAGRAAKEPWQWTAFESLQVANLRDRTVLRLALDSAMAEAAAARKARGDSALSREMLGVAARESTVAKMNVTYDAALLAKLAQTFAALPQASADSSMMVRLRMMGQMPAIEPADSARAVAWSSVGTYRVGDMTEAWRKLNPLFRPRIETPDQVRDLVKNGLFERALRREAERTRLERDPRVTEVVRRQAELNDVEYLVRREVYGGLPDDSLTLRRFYDSQPKTWEVPERAHLVRMILPDRAEAARMMERLREAAEAESLLARGARQRVNYGVEVTSFSDSAGFASAKRAGVGAVLGPEAVADGWLITRVHGIEPAQLRGFDEAVEMVRKLWLTEEGERRMRAFLDDLRAKASVAVNDAAVARLVREGVPVTGAVRRPGSSSR